ncbi:MAG: glycosyltransferase family 9 protein [Oscillochloris sp.]|nr:glycosyltransferase family 9 protein [Oscillochloris sp.]
MSKLRSIFLYLLASLSRLGARRRPTELRTILVVKPDALGDLLLATPALRRLRQGLPAARIVGTVGPWSRIMWANNPDLDALDELPFPGFGRTRARHPYWLLLRAALLLRRQKYDAALLLRDDHWWGAALIALAGIPLRIGHAHPLCAPFLTEALPYNPTEHVSRQSLAVAEKLIDMTREPDSEPQPPSPALRFEPSPADHTWAASWLHRQLGPGERFVVIHPGASGPTKAWPAERWASLGDALAGRGLRVVLTGGTSEVALAQQVADQMQRPALSVAGATAIGQLAALLAHTSLVVGGDTGPLHIAVSQGCPTIHLFGPSDPARFGPWGDPQRNRVLSAGLACSPCSNFSVCPRKTDPAECMQAITLAQVLSAIESLMRDT